MTDTEKEIALRLAQKDEKLAMERWQAAMDKLNEAQQVEAQRKQGWEAAREKLRKLYGND